MHTHGITDSFHLTSCLQFVADNARSARIGVESRLRSGILEIIVREQGGDDEEFRALEQQIQTFGKQPNRDIRIVRNENLGFAGGHNATFREAKGDFILALNADAVLQPNYLTQALAAFDDSRVGAVQGKLLRWDLDAMDTPVLAGNPPRPVFDTTGLLLLRNRRIINRGQGTIDQGQFDEAGEVWGADGALPIYRRAALVDVAFTRADGSAEFYDEDFFAYKEDVDLCVAYAVAWLEGDVCSLCGWLARTFRRRERGTDVQRNHCRASKDRSPAQVLLLLESAPPPHKE